MIGRVLFDNNDYLVTSGLLGGIKVYFKPRGMTFRTSARERRHLKDTVAILQQHNVPIDPNNADLQELFEGFARAIIGRGDASWEAWFMHPPEYWASAILEEIQSERGNKDEVIDHIPRTELDAESIKANQEQDASPPAGPPDSPPSDNIVGLFNWDGMPVVVTRAPGDNAMSAWSSASPGKRWRAVPWPVVLDEGRSLSESDWNAAFDRWFQDPTPAGPPDYPPTENVVGYYMWDWMPVVMTRDPADDRLAAWSSASPGKRWRPVSPTDVLGEGRELTESDWSAIVQPWFDAMEMP